MQPPICAVCQLDFRDRGDGGLVEFSKTDADVAWDRRSQAEGFTGHPPYAAWFCDRHLRRAQRLEACGLTCDEARRQLRSPAWLDPIRALFRWRPRSNR